MPSAAVTTSRSTRSGSRRRERNAWCAARWSAAAEQLSGLQR